MSELVPLGPHVAGALAVLGLHDRYSLVHAQPVPLETDELAGIVGDRSYRVQAEVEQDLGADAVVPKIGLEPELLVGFDRVRPLILKLVRLELVEQADAASFLVEIDDHAPAF